MMKANLVQGGTLPSFYPKRSGNFRSHPPFNRIEFQVQAPRSLAPGLVNVAPGFLLIGYSGSLGWTVAVTTGPASPSR